MLKLRSELRPNLGGDLDKRFSNNRKCQPQGRSPPLLLKLVVASGKVMGVPCSADPYYDEEEVILSSEVPLSRDPQNDMPWEMAYWVQ